MLIYLQMIETQEEKTKFEQIYFEYRGLMFYIAESILHNEHDAEDVVHDAFVSIAENIVKIGDPVCPKTKAYVVTIVERKAINVYRRKCRRSETSFDEETIGLRVEYSKAHAIARCFSLLPKRYRHVLSLKYRYGYDSREIARLLNITESNASKLIQRAKVKLDALCKEEDLR